METTEAERVISAVRLVAVVVRVATVRAPSSARTSFSKSVLTSEQHLVLTTYLKNLYSTKTKDVLSFQDLTPCLCSEIGLKVCSSHLMCIILALAAVLQLRIQVMMAHFVMAKDPTKKVGNKCLGECKFRVI